MSAVDKALHRLFQTPQHETTIVYRGSGGDLATDIVPLLETPQERAAFITKFRDRSAIWGVTIDPAWPLLDTDEERLAFLAQVRVMAQSWGLTL